jgi:hypothetical protein
MASKKLGHLASEIALLKHGFANEKTVGRLYYSASTTLCRAHSLSKDGSAAARAESLFLITSAH